jgi:hypothetical protein
MRANSAGEICRQLPKWCGSKHKINGPQWCALRLSSDGSFSSKPADRRIRFLLVDEKVTVVRQEHGWFWIRFGGQRICVGCHTGPERAAENNVPAVLLRSTTPVDLSGAQAPDTTRQAEKGSR